MNNSSKKPIITHIPDFLEYYENKRYSQETTVTYTRLLDKFKIWLKRTSRTGLLPNKLSQEIINEYKGPKQASSRLTGRSVENIVKKYAIKANLSLSLTPENLRNAYVLSLLNQENNIKITGKLSHHKDLVVNTYRFITTEDSNEDRMRPQLLPWNIVETSVNKEIAWLKDNISILPESYKQKHLLINCDDCLLRKLAILITSGKVETTRFKAKKGKDLWNSLMKQEKFQKISKHGEEWHRRMIDVISNYFKLQHYKTIAEPILNYGRADLGVYSDSKKPLYIEVGTVSLYKLWYNVLTMKNSYFLLVPSEEYAIEFKI